MRIRFGLMGSIQKPVLCRVARKKLSALLPVDEVGLCAAARPAEEMPNASIGIINAPNRDSFAIVYWRCQRSAGRLRDYP